MRGKFLRWLGGILFFILVVFTGLGSYGLYDVLHPPRNIPLGKTLREQGIPFQRITLVTEDGIELVAWYTPPRRGTVILLAHGYGHNRPEWVYALLAKKGYGVLAWDARAHGESGGTISTLGYREVMDVKAALNYALSQPEVYHVGGWGGSMGGATMIRAAAEYPQIEALVVDSAFSSLEAEVDFLSPYPMFNPIAKVFMSLGLGVNLDSVSPAAVIGQISPRPVYIIQGTADKVAAPESAQQLFDAAQEPKSLWLQEDAIHLGIYIQNPGRYQRRVLRFYDDWFLPEYAAP
ncbi:MAG TPA: alpha/beta hydrolase [Anaerolineales bacterium]|nr:alpha/beta hydrolase [Anaerolineales bacterium]HNA88621.1 alpha/beta hydrolase [Anaerolineales bacterium]HNB36961.1 alpha/beta hydrolase [Anaerolineales bacterium]HNC08346.1 alpha/beta hydrolase [Anaerolineales bacterium]